MDRFVTTSSSARAAVPSKKLRETQEHDTEAPRPTKRPRPESSTGEPEEGPAGDAKSSGKSSHQFPEYIESSESSDEIPFPPSPPE
ncbi:hypothetical protein M501DRAFT_999668 [Patellaria atrata CBS 101060]|uniref:Uncharacterized protein n=1 Tax=Patellaria atrata CBS 101060 TaxID=1346257 RepID=A0A9P4VKV5_9PEZI|nr:hypothetical protein M501DRAFT_999668 [Patellaria atrata CBS 101060]